MLKYDHLEGLAWDLNKQNCYVLLRTFYKDNFGIDLPDYVVPTDFWGGGMDLYRELSFENGFRALDVHPRDWQPGDVILMAIKSSTGNHVGIYLDNNRILHHLYGQRSCVTQYMGLFRNTTVGIYRHQDTPATRQEHLVDIRTLVPPHVRVRLEEIEAARRAAAGEAPAGP